MTDWTEAPVKPVPSRKAALLKAVTVDFALLLALFLGLLVFAHLVK